VIYRQCIDICGIAGALGYLPALLRHQSAALAPIDGAVKFLVPMACGDPCAPCLGIFVAAISEVLMGRSWRSCLYKTGYVLEDPSHLLRLSGEVQGRTPGGSKEVRMSNDRHFATMFLASGGDIVFILGGLSLG
jgi:hypothetical protein